MKLRTRILLFVVLISIISIIFVSGVNYFVSIRKLEETVNEKFILNSSYTAEEMDKWMAIQKNYLDTVIDMVVLNDRHEYDYMTELFTQITNDNPGNFYYAAYGNKDIFAPEDANMPEDYDGTTREWYIEARKRDDFFITEPYIDMNTGSMVITISKQFNTKDGMEAVMATDITIDSLVDIATGASYAAGSYAFLLDDRGS